MTAVPGRGEEHPLSAACLTRPAERGRYNPAVTTLFRAAPPRLVARSSRSAHPMADTLVPATPSAGTGERAHKAKRRYIYAWGGGRAEGNAQMRDLLGGK